MRLLLCKVFDKATATLVLFLFKEFPLCLNFGVGFKLRACFGIENMVLCRGIDKVIEDGGNEETALQFGFDGNEQEVNGIVVVHCVQNRNPSKGEEFSATFGHCV